MPDPNDAPALLRSVGLLADGPVTWGRPVRQPGPGVYVVELPAPLSAAPLDLALIGKWLERVPDLRLDGERPSSRDLLARLAAFWLPAQRVLLIGSSSGSVGGRIAAVQKTVPGDRRPASSGLWLHFLRDPGELRVWWAQTDAVEEYEDALLEAFAAGVTPDEAASLPGGGPLLPWATLRTATGDRKPTGITGPLLPEIIAAAPPPVTRIVDLPEAEADGARDEAKRPRRPARGRGAGRVASAAGYAAQGSPRRAPEPVYLSPEGLDRVQEELRELRDVRRPEVIKRIATAREHGDLKENAEYHAAREEGGFLEGRIRALEAKLKVAVIVEPTERGAVVEIGSRVRLTVDEEPAELVIVGSTESDPAGGRISNVSPVGRALLGRRVGDVVTIRTPGGEIRYEVLAIE
jgi:transcription elongation factor GreA